MAAKNKTLFGDNGANEITGKGGNDIIFGYSVETIAAERVGTGFTGPVAAVAAPGDPGFLYVIEKGSGDIFRLNVATGISTPFLNIPDSELDPAGEQGLLAIAFHPDYDTNGQFFVHMVNDNGDLELREYASDGGVDQDPVQTIIAIPHPDGDNHNGGELAFGPDGYLYYSIGDGTEGDNSQDLGSLLGKILRIDVDGDDFPSEGERNYAIPDDNPFVGEPGRDEIWAYGLRNPWRMSFDSKTGDLYIGDVGNSEREEIDFQPASNNGGKNYGWPDREGTLGDDPPGGSADPIFEYDHSLGSAVTGGVVYRAEGSALDGHYFFADFGSGRLWTLKVEDGKATQIVERTDQVEGDVDSLSHIVAFSTDADGNLFAVSLDGDIFRLTPVEPTDDLGDTLKGGAGNDRLYGGFGDDKLKGNAGNDKLDGGADADILSGGGGKDRFLFTAALGDNIDTVKDFTGDDKIKLAQDVFSALALGKLGENQFHVGSEAEDGADRIIYDKATGELKYDADGNGAVEAVTFALLDPKLKLDSSDFIVF